MRNITLLDVKAVDFDKTYSELGPNTEYLFNIKDLGDSEWSYSGSDLLEFFEKRVSSCGYYFYRFFANTNSLKVLKKVWNLEDVEIEKVFWKSQVFTGEIFCINGLPVAFAKRIRGDLERYLAFPAKLVAPKVPEVPKDLSPEDVLNILNTLD